MKPITPDELTRLRQGLAGLPATNLRKRLVTDLVAARAENAELRAALAQVGPAQLALFPAPTPALEPAEVA